MTWEELFFDLAFVFALTQFSRLLHEHGGWIGIAHTLIVFVPVYWAWGGVTLYINQRDVNSLLDRVGILTLGLGSLLMALTIPGAYGDRSLPFIVIYLASRILLALLALRRRAVWRALFVGPYGAFLLTGPLLLSGAVLPGTTRVALWGAAALVDLLSPWVARHLVAQSRVHPLHYTHRYGLLIILVLGESVIQVGVRAVDDPLTPARVTAVGAAYALVGALWWAYFRYGVPDFRRAMEQAPDQPDLRRAVLVYGHLAFSFGIITLAVGLAELAPSPLDEMPEREMLLLFGGSALFLSTFAFTHWRIHHRIAWHRVAAAAVCLVLVPVATLVPALVALAALVLVIVLMIGAEETTARRHGADVVGERAEEESRGDAARVDEGPVSGD
ncbi:low temperature requirement protein A [Plantactinospora sp. WMMB334]|uniref:low temperature requirement protein A n=1 Tax=Plantactinospora sp. WMMB334 TaxID=3404119 RepID=UPI003B9609DA